MEKPRGILVGRSESYSQAISKDFGGGQGSAIVWLPLLGNSIHYNRAVEFPLDLDRLAGWLSSNTNARFSLLFIVISKRI